MLLLQNACTFAIQHGGSLGSKTVPTLDAINFFYGIPLAMQSAVQCVQLYSVKQV